MKRGALIILTLWFTCFLYAEDLSHDSLHYADGTKIYADTAVYQGTQIKLDLGTFALEAISSLGKVWSTEVAVSVRFKNRFYPTFETGYVHAGTTHDSIQSAGQGAFMRLGMDINGLRKNIYGPNAFLVGIRAGTALQDYIATDLRLTDASQIAQASQQHRFRCDAWGEIVVGCNVQVWAGLMMGWSVRMKFLFTTKVPSDTPLPYYIPGYGYRENMAWGINYYIGYKF